MKQHRPQFAIKIVFIFLNIIVPIVAKTQPLIQQNEMKSKINRPTHFSKIINTKMNQ